MGITVYIFYMRNLRLREWMVWAACRTRLPAAGHQLLLFRIWWVPRWLCARLCRGGPWTLPSASLYSTLGQKLPDITVVFLFPFFKEFLDCSKSGSSGNQATKLNLVRFPTEIGTETSKFPVWRRDQLRSFLRSSVEHIYSLYYTDHLSSRIVLLSEYHSDTKRNLIL